MFAFNRADLSSCFKVPPDMIARHHHYLSQCYLKGFTKGNSKNSKFLVIDIKERKKFETVPRNVGGIRDFNRIDFEGVDPNVLEDALASFEGEAASALRKLRDGDNFDGEVKDAILNLMTLFAVRSPEMREHWRKSFAQIADRLLDLTVQTKERWESQMEKIRREGINLAESIQYDDFKKFVESKRYIIGVPRERHILMEFGMFGSVLECLVNRKWLLVKSTKESGPIITTDKPVNLTWKDPEKIPPIFRNTPGYAMKETQVYFPISKDMALIGEFGGPEGMIEGTRELIATLNSLVILFPYKQIYAPSLGFYFHDSSNNISEGKFLLRQICVRS